MKGSTRFAWLLAAGLWPFAAGAQQAQACDGMRLYRAGFTTAVQDREPVDQPETLPAGTAPIFYFSEAGTESPQAIVHLWSFNGEPLKRIELAVRGARYRTWSAVPAADLGEGELQVQLQDSAGCVLHLDRLRLVARDAAAPVTHAPIADAGRVDKLLEKAVAARQAGNFDSARKILKDALTLALAGSAERVRLNDELRFHLPLAIARGQIQRKEAKALRATLAPVREYVEDHPKRAEYGAILENYYKALRMMELNR